MAISNYLREKGIATQRKGSNTYLSSSRGLIPINGMDSDHLKNAIFKRLRVAFSSFPEPYSVICKVFLEAIKDLSHPLLAKALNKLGSHIKWPDKREEDEYWGMVWELSLRN